ncbi:MAG: hypothetical protein BGO98_37310 [Myxococcales bacterium 68-20]|nr:MAG: hypothetical protein BGO98_37310 [Myxococcales bacterium 68-20]
MARGRSGDARRAPRRSRALGLIAIAACAAAPCLRGAFDTTLATTASGFVSLGVVATPQSSS